MTPTALAAASLQPVGSLYPKVPSTLQESGLGFDLVTQLVLKTLHLAGELTGIQLARRLGLRFHVFEPCLTFLRREQLVQIAGSSVFGGPTFCYRITDAGRTRAELFLEHNHYVGTAPVPLAQYQRYMDDFRQVDRGKISKTRVRQAFAHLVLSQRVLDQIGPAVDAGQSMFIYGPPGNGKTVISQAIQNLLDGDIAIPGALEVQGNIVSFFDPVNHEPLEPLRPVNDSLEDTTDDDMRWIRCRRPAIMAGGELEMESLDLSFVPATGFYRAPIQAQANGGVLIIDDFGRQRCVPRDLLNRWIVPLESQVDFLTLQTGQKFAMPFNVLVIFATNIRPLDLVDEAFLRRIHHKIFAESPSVADFVRIFENCCVERGLDFDPKLVELMFEDSFRPRHIPLRGCQPRDLIKHAISLAHYHGVEPRLTRDLLYAACESYFVDDTESRNVYA